VDSMMSIQHELAAYPQGAAMTQSPARERFSRSASGTAVSTGVGGAGQASAQCEAAPRVPSRHAASERAADHQAVRAAHQLRQVLRREERKRLRKLDEIRQDLVELQTPKDLDNVRAAKSSKKGQID